MINNCNILWIILFFIIYVASKQPTKVETFNNQKSGSIIELPLPPPPDYKSCCKHYGSDHEKCLKLNDGSTEESNDIKDLKKVGLLKPLNKDNKPLIIFSYLNPFHKTRSYVILPNNIAEPLNVKMLNYNDVLKINKELYRVVLFKPENNLPLYMDKYIYNGKLNNSNYNSLYLYVKKENKLFDYQAVILKNNKPITFAKFTKNKPYQIGSIVTVSNNDIQYGPFILN